MLQQITILERKPYNPFTSLTLIHFQPDLASLEKEIHQKKFKLH